MLAWPPMIARITAAYLAVGVLAVAAWLLTGNQSWVVQFFQVPAAALMIGLAFTELWFCFNVVRYFAPDDLLRPGWVLIGCSAGCQVLGMICSQVLGVDSRLNPLAISAGAQESVIPMMRNIGLLIGGTFRFALLAGGLYFALKAYRQSGLLGRLSRWDRTVLGGFAVFVLRNVADVVVATQNGKRPDVWGALSWPVDPLLLLLLVQSLILFRSANQMSSGRIGLCWKAYSAGVFFTALGDISIWATYHSFLPWPWSALGWYVWLPAAASFARGAAFQLEVILNGRAVARPFLREFLNLSES